MSTRQQNRLVNSGVWAPSVPVTESKDVQSQPAPAELDAIDGPLLAAAPAPILCFQRSGAILNVNPAARQLLGISPTQKQCGHVAAHLPAIQSWLGPHLQTPTASEMEARRQNGSVLTVMVSLVQVPAPQGTYYAAFLQDLSERKAAERRLLASNEWLMSSQQELSEKSEELYLLLDRSVELQVAAEAASKVRQEILTATSHELRTPIAAILGFADLLVEEAQQDNLREFACIVQKNGRELLKTINEILDLASIETGQLQPLIGTFKPCTVVEDALQTLRAKATRRGVRLHFKAAADVPETFVSDQRKFRQILLNIVSNAIKFTRDGDAYVELFYDVLVSPPRLRVEVIDSGVGMSESQLQRLFEPFTHAEDASAARVPGAGLGLAISRRLCRLLGGDISVESQPGRGSTFSFWIPAPKAAPATRLFTTAHAAPAADESEARPPVGLLGRRILIVDDNRDNVHYLHHILAKAGAIVEIAADGQMALDTLQALTARGLSLDCLLLDLQMPVMDGFTAAREFRARDYTGPIIAVTAADSGTAIDRCRVAGCDDYVTKPVDRRPLLNLIEQHLTRCQSPTSESDQTLMWD